ncbi:unnamed protein product [Cuscuta campestris]|uniref:Uncharacterized protein n=1 Tax=Cuscuta campestris TaxID=132261 RepID=A0A484MYP0_9ASTE|nr:unnamed protein product [Cuscuta campestris]
MVLDEEEVQSQARVPAAQRLGPQVPEAGEFQDLRKQIQEMQRKVNRGRVFTTRTNTPLAPEIFAEPYPRGFKVPFVKRYDGESDPQEHINSYVQVMIAVDASGALMCRCFLQTADSKVVDWVNHIPAGSIRTWDELGLRFLEHFAGNCRPKKHFTHLASVRQKHGESLKNFLVRWRKESREVEGTDDKSRLAMFTAALQDGLLHTDLTTLPPDTFEEAMVRAGRYATLEERKEEKKEKTPKEEEKVGNKKPFKNKKQGFPDGPRRSTNLLIQCLHYRWPRRFWEVFEWSPADILGLDHKIAVHRLNVLQNAKPVKQKRRHLSQERRDFVKKEVTTLQSIGHIREGGKFLGHMVSRRGIEANPEKVRAIMEMEPPKTAKEVQRLTGRLAALNRFLSKVEEKVHPFFTVIKKKATFEWTQECQVAFEELKKYLASPLVLSKPEPGDVLTLHLAIADCAISTVIVREENGAQHPVNYVSKTLRDAELRYSRPEKAMLAVFWTAKRLTPYFQAHRIVVLTNEPLASLTRSPAASARMTKWAVFISQYNVEFRPRPSIKGHALADFKVECTAREMTRARVDTRVEDDLRVISIDGSSGSRSCGAGIVLTTPESFRIYYAIRFQFRVSNNEAEYEALINGLKILGKLGVSRVQVYSDSRLVVGQISGEFEAKEERMKKYRDLSLEMLGKFEYKLEHIPRAYNTEADVLSKLSAESPEYISKLATVEELATPSLNRDEVLWVSADPPEWLDRLARYIKDGVAPEDPLEARLLRMRAPTYKELEGILYKRSYNGVLLRCLRAAEAKALMEEIHEGVCAGHQGPYSISRRAIIQGYFWPTMRKDCEEYVRKCPTCQQFQNIPGRPATNYTPISSVIPFSRWGINIVGALPKGIGQARWILVAIDYLTKWVEAELLAGITGKQMIDFVGTNILCRFGVPKQIIFDNETQFEEAEFQDFLKTWGIQHTKVSVAYPQANGQVENVNRTIISGIKKKLLSEGSKWVDELPRILWTYKTTLRRATGDTPFGLAYGFEARAPAETMISTRREMTYDPEVNEQNQAIELNFLEERRDEARIRAENYRRQVKSYFDSKVKPRAFQVGDYVLRKREKSQPTKGGKLAKKYQGPYIIKAVVRPGILICFNNKEFLSSKAKCLCNSIVL